MRRRSICAGLLSCLAAMTAACGARHAEDDVRRPSLLEDVGLVGGPADLRLQAVATDRDDGWFWASGTRSSWLRGEIDGSAAPEVRVHADGELEFRDVEAFSRDRAVLLAAGSGSASRILRTEDGGVSWVEQWRGSDPESPGEEAVFLDCLDFWDGENGLVYGDSLSGRLFVLRTDDGGATWRRLETLPPALAGEGGFAASGDCLRTAGEGWAGIVTGAGERPRLLVTEDRGATWSVHEPPLPSGPAAGGFALSVADDPRSGRWFVVGGDLERMDERGRYVAVSDDRGASWSLLAELPFDGPAYGVAVDHAAGQGREVVVVVGPGGVARSLDGGVTFELWRATPIWSVVALPGGRGLLVGPDRRLTRYSLTGG